MERDTNLLVRRSFLWRIFRPTWKWLIVAPLALIGSLQTVRDNFLPTSVVEYYELSWLIPNWPWEWPASVPAFQQPPGNHLRLNFGRTLEDVEDARIAEHAADRVFEGEAVAAVNLQCIVGGCPGNARAK